MNWYEQVLISCKRIETALNLRHKNTNRMNGSDVLKYYDELCDKITAWEEQNQMELKY